MTTTPSSQDSSGKQTVGYIFNGTLFVPNESGLLVPVAKTSRLIIGENVTAEQVADMIMEMISDPGLLDDLEGDEYQDDEKDGNASLAEVFANEIKRALEGTMPVLDTVYYLKWLSLQSNVPDHRDLIDRFLPPGNEILSRDFRSVLRLMHQAKALMSEVGLGPLSDSKEAVLKIFADVGGKQLVREGNICPTALEICQQLYLYRPEYLSKEAKQILATLK